MRIQFVLGVACIAAMALGCDKKGDATKPDPSASSSATAAAKPKTGIDNPANDPELVKAARQVLVDCGKTMDEKESGGKIKLFSDCGEKYTAFRDAKFTNVEATCFNLLEDDDVKVRSVGVSCLNSWGDKWRSDKVLAGRLVGVVEKEKSGSPIDAQLADMTLSISTSAGGADRIKAIALKAETPADVKSLIAAFWSGPEEYEIVKTFSTSTDPKLVLAAVQGYVRVYDDHADEACTYWTNHLEDADTDTRHVAFGHMTGGWTGNNSRDADSVWYVSGGGGGPRDEKPCSAAQLETAVATAEKLVSAGTFDDSYYVYGLKSIIKGKTTPAALKKHAIAVLHACIDNKDCGQRTSALYGLVEADPRQKAYAATLAKDPALKSTVTSILQKK
ncbi:hypothetical protein BH09MYX1_BH09MYX1_16140 [soil metagenome]